MTSAPLLLLADADHRRRDLLQKHLQAQGFRVDVKTDGIQAKGALLSKSPRLAILSSSLPLISGIELCKQLRDQGLSLPLFIISSVDRFSDRVEALNAGADEALSFPFALEEFTARIQSLLRRSLMGPSDVVGSLIEYRDLIVNTDTRELSRAGNSLKLTVKEYELLIYLLRHRGRVLSRHQILLAVWGDTWLGDDNLLDVYIRYLRKKIEQPALDPLIHTVRGVGFVLR